MRRLFAPTLRPLHLLLNLLDLFRDVDHLASRCTPSLESRKSMLVKLKKRSRAEAR